MLRHVNSRKGGGWNCFLALACVGAGICLMFYPWLSETLYEHRTDSGMKLYSEKIEETSDTALQEQWELAEQYNQQLGKNRITLQDPFVQSLKYADDRMDYDDILAENEDGLMGFIEIPVISVYLPIYHGTDAATLNKGIGHLEGSSLPVGGESTHCVLSGHTGLNSAKLFTDLTELEKGDLFYLHILDRVLDYRVVEKSVVDPDDVSTLTIREKQDLVTLVTCTPYGANTYRLLVTGERTELTEEDSDSYRQEQNAESSQWLKNYKKAIAAGALLAVIGFGTVEVVQRCLCRKEK